MNRIIFLAVAVVAAGLSTGYTQKLFGAGEGELYGFIDLKDNWVVRPLFANVAEFRRDMRLVESGATHLWGYIDLHSGTVVPQKFNRAQKFEGGLARAKEGGIKSLECLSPGSFYVIHHLLIPIRSS